MHWNIQDQKPLNKIMFQMVKKNLIERARYLMILTTGTSQSPKPIVLSMPNPNAESTEYDASKSFREDSSQGNQTKT